MAKKSNEADFLAQLSALESKKAELPKAAPPARKQKKPAPRSAPPAKDDFLADIQAFKAKGKRDDKESSPGLPPARPPVAKKTAGESAPPILKAPKLETPPPQDMASLDLDIPLLDESGFDSPAKVSDVKTAKGRSVRARGDSSTELSVIRQHLEEALERLIALEGSAPSGPVKLGAMGGIESEPTPYARVKAETSGDGSSFQPASARDRRAVRRDVDSILENAGKMSLEEEINTFTELIRSVQCLNPLFPRIQEIIDRGEMSQPVLLALYRSASRFLQGEISQRENEIESTQKEFKKYRESMKRLNNVLGGQKQMPGMAGPGDRGGAPVGEDSDSGEMFVLREQIKQKDRIIEQFDKRVDSVKNDFERYKERQQKDIDRLVIKDREEFMGDLLNVVDNFERAMDSLNQTRNVEAMIQGVKMIHDEFLGVLEKYGLEEVKADMVKFDPHVHEAMMREDTDDYPDGTVIQVLRKGYMMKEKLLRPAQVKTTSRTS